MPPFRSRAFGLALLGAIALAGCHGDGGAAAEAASGAPSAPLPVVTIAPRGPLPLQASSPTLDDPNPLRLPPRKIKLDPGRRVFTFSDRMLAGAKLGSTLILYAAT